MQIVIKICDLSLEHLMCSISQAFPKISAQIIN